MPDHALKHQRAAARWLKDPDDPDEFTVEPRASEIQVVFSYWDGKNTVTEKAQLQSLLEDIKGRDPEWEFGAVNINTADLRDHSLKTLEKVDMVMDKFAKTQGLYKEKAINPVDRAAATAEEIRAFLQENPEIAHDPDLKAEFSTMMAQNAGADPEEVGKLIN